MVVYQTQFKKYQLGWNIPLDVPYCPMVVKDGLEKRILEKLEDLTPL
jgi:hypothetical protein